MIFTFQFALFFCFIYYFGHTYINEISDTASGFAEIIIDADDAKYYITSRNTDDEYTQTNKYIKEYAENNSKYISEISLISYSNSCGYYIYNSSGNPLGTKVSYDDYTLSMKAELINGRNKWQYNDGKYLYSYTPVRTIDDKLAGYIIVKANNIPYYYYIIFAVCGFVAAITASFLFSKSVCSFTEKSVLSPLRKINRTALEFMSSLNQKKDINIESLFETYGNQISEISDISETLKKLLYDVVNSNEHCTNAVYAATHDGMTQVYNKRNYTNMIADFRKCSSICVIYFDVNNLKLMNDTLGHENGDYVIKQAADYIKQFTDDSSFCFRMGGDEFLLVMCNCTYQHMDNVTDILDTDAPVILSHENDSVQCALSYGYAYGKDKFSYEIILAEAEENMYKKKKELKQILNMPDR